MPKLTSGFIFLLSLMYLLLQITPAQAITLTTHDYYTDNAFTTAFTRASATYGRQQTLYHKADGVPAAHEFKYTVNAAGGSVTVLKNTDNLQFDANAAAEVTNYQLEWNYASNVDLSSATNLYFRFLATHATDISVEFFDDDDGTAPGYTYMRNNIGGNVNQLATIPVSALINDPDLDAAKIRRIKATFTPTAGNTKGFDLTMLDVDSSTTGTQLISTTTPEPGLPALAGAALLLMQTHRTRRNRKRVSRVAG